MEVFKYGASGIPTGVAGGEQCMLLVCPYPGSPVATSWLSMLSCRGMQVLSANQVLVLVLSDLFFSIGDETQGHVKLWALAAPCHQQYDNYLHGLPQLLGIILSWCQHQPEDQLGQAARQLRFQVCHQVLQKHLRVQSPAVSAGMDQLRQHERKKSGGGHRDWRHL